MKKKFLPLLAILFLSHCLAARQWIAFCAQEGGDPHGFTYFVKEKPADAGGGLEVAGSWGFAPVNWVVPLFYGDGTISDNSGKTIGDVCIIEVTDKEWTAALATKDEWQDKFYGLTTNNCVDFLRAIVSNIEGLQAPHAIYAFPSGFVAQLKLLNRQRWENSVTTFSIASKKTNPQEAGSGSGATTPNNNTFDKSKVATGNSTSFTWISWNNPAPWMIEMTRGITTDVLGNTLYKQLTQDFKECDAEIAVIDLNNDNILGLLVKVTGLKCTGQYYSEYYDVFENGGMLTVNIRLDEDPFPYPGGIKFKTGIEKLKKNPITKYKSTATLPAIFKMDSPKNDLATNQTENTNAARQTNSLAFLNELNGKYMFEVNIFDNPVMKQRLQKLVGKEFIPLKTQLFGVVGPYEVKNGMFYFWGMVPHSGGDPGALIMADITKDILYVGIRRNKKIQYFKETETQLPQRMIEWSKEKTY